MNSNHQNSIIMGRELLYYIGAGGTVVIPDSVNQIKDRAFRGRFGLTAVVIPDSVTKIGEGAFAECSGLTSVTLPDSITEIIRYVFYGCSNPLEYRIMAGIAGFEPAIPALRAGALTHLAISHNWRSAPDSNRSLQP